MQNGISVVVPVYNAEGTLVELMRRLANTLAGMQAAYEVILVNDASHDLSGPGIPGDS